MMHDTVLHARLPHQPKMPEEHIQPSEAELAKAFENTIAVVLAYDEETTPFIVNSDNPEEPITCTGSDGKDVARPLQAFEDKSVVEHVLDLAQTCRFANISVLTANDDVKQIVQNASQSASTPCEAIDFSKSDAFSGHEDGHTFEVIGITKNIFDICAKLAAQTSGCKRVMILRADSVRLTPWHLIQLNNKLDSDPDAEIVTSWITRLRRLPMLFTTDFIKDIDARRLNAFSEEAPHRPLPNLPLTDFVFGEERLESNVVIPDKATAFTKEHTLSALEAVRLARRLQTAKTAGDNDISDSLKATIEQMNDADTLLAREACAVTEWRQRLLEKDTALASELHNADEFGKREKDCFPIFATKENAEDLVYLDSAATSQRLRCALDAEYRFNAHGNANIYRGSYKLSAEATATYDEARAAIEHFINADRRQTVMTMNATQSLNLIAQAWGEHNINAGDTIVTALDEHHSDILPWMMLAKRKGAHLRYIGINADGTLDLDEYTELLKEKPKLVCVAHISNVIGIRNPVERMAQMAHDAGARLAVDAAQSIPHIPVDVKALGADFVAFSGHKLYGPFGIGCLWIHPDAFAEMDPLGGGGGTVSYVSKDSYYLRQGAIQYEMGTPPIAQAVGLAAACKHLEIAEMDKVALHDRALTRYLMTGLQELGFVTAWGDHTSDDGLYGLVALSVLGADAALIGRLMGNMNVAVRSGGHCALPLAASMGLGGTTRISFGIHTTSEDIDAALTALRVCGKLLDI